MRTIIPNGCAIHRSARIPPRHDRGLGPSVRPRCRQGMTAPCLAVIARAARRRRCRLRRVADEQVTEPDSTAVRVALWRAMHVRGGRAAARARGRDRAAAGGPGGRLARPAGHGPGVHQRVPRGRSWRAPGSSRTWSPSGPRTGRASTCCSARASTRSRSAARTSRRGCGCSRWTSRARRRGSGGASSSSATASRSGCGWSRWTSRRAPPGGRRSRRPGSTPARPAVVASAGVSMYLTREANAATLRDLATLAPGSTVAMTFLLPLDLVDERDRPGLDHVGERRQVVGDAVPQLLRPAGVPRPGPRGRVQPTCGTCPGATSTTGTSPAAPTGCACRPARTSWSRPPSGSRARPGGRGTPLALAHERPVP